MFLTFIANCGFFGCLSLVGAVAAPFLLHGLVSKAAEHRPAIKECGALSVFGLAFCLWLLSVFTALPAA